MILEQVCLLKVDAIGDTVARGISRGYSERGCGNIRSENFGMRKFSRQRYGEAS